MRGFKGFDYQLRCTPTKGRTKQYHIGQTVRLCASSALKMCKRGLHFCEKLWDVFIHYPPFDVRTGERSRYAEIITGWHGRSLIGLKDPDGVPHKRCAGDMLIRNEMRLEEMWPRRGNGWIKKYVPLQQKQGVARDAHLAVTLRDSSVAISEKSHAIACGCNSAAFGFMGAVASGVCSYAQAPSGIAVALASGACACAAGSRSVALSPQFAEAKRAGAVAITQLCARGVKGSTLIFITRLLPPYNVMVVPVDGKKIKENVWYRCGEYRPDIVPFYDKDREA